MCLQVTSHMEDGTNLVLAASRRSTELKDLTRRSDEFDSVGNASVLVVGVVVVLVLLLVLLALADLAVILVRRCVDVERDKRVLQTHCYDCQCRCLGWLAKLVQARRHEERDGSPLGR